MEPMKTSGLSQENERDLNRKMVRSLQTTIEKEKRWCDEAYEKPNIGHIDSLDDLRVFKGLIWDHPPHNIIDSFGHTPKEVAALCGEGSSGWLMSSHIHVIFQKLNNQQERCMNVLGNFMSTNEMEQLAERMGERVERLNVVLNVGKDIDGSVFVSSVHKSGNHWVLASMDLTSNPTVLYCDSLGWKCPTNLLDYLCKFSSVFGIVRLERLVMMHDPSGTGHIHQCTENCTNYPLQTCSNVCGLVAVACAVIFALDKPLFQNICDNKFSSKFYLHFPTRYEKLLRRIIIYFFVNDEITSAFFNTKPDFISLDHSYTSAISNKANKRKVPTSIYESSQPPKIHKKETNYCPFQCQQEIEFTLEILFHPNNNNVPSPDCLSSINKNDPKVVNDCTSKKNPKIKIYNCHICKINFNSRQILYRHKKQEHNAELNHPKHFIHCNECSVTFSTISELIFHYNKIHHKHMTISSKSFKTDDQFKEWKKDMERQTCAQYFLKRFSQTRKNKIYYYYCKRSGKKPTSPNNERKRALKSQGSCKIDNYCTSFLTVRKSLTDHSISVDYCLDHCGHSLSLGHLNISEDIRCEIASKLSQGLGPSQILEMIRNNISHIDRDSLVNSKDIHNIKHQYNISQNHKHKEDGKSVDLWVKEFEKEEDNPILFYKPQYEKYEGLNSNDFLICIQTKFQRETMLKYGSKIICVDSTHSTTQYDFLLITLLVLDDFGEAVPVAWAISNKEDFRTLNIFMSKLRASCGVDVLTNVFMSDMADNFYNAWCTSFSHPYKRIHCTWHVDRAWKNKINAFIKDDQKKVNIYTALKMLQDESSEKKFRVLLPKCLAYLEEEAENFYSYFVENYVQRDKFLLWAGCYRLGTPANTNMHAESFHNVLKSVYFQRKQNRRVDDLLLTLLKLSRDKNIDQIIKLEKGKVTHRIREIRARHKASLDIFDIQEISETEWIVPSSDKSKNYNVCLLMKVPCSCKLACNICFVCAHMYACTCNDFLLRSLSCKHIHAVHRTRNISSQNKEDKQADFEHLSTLKSFVQDNNKDKSQNGRQAKTSCLKRAYDIIQLVENTDDYNLLAIKAILESLNKTYVIGRGLQKHNYEQKINIEKTQSFSSNKKFENQKNFVSTKKKVKGSKLKLKRTEIKEKECIEKDILSASANVCSLCFSNLDNNCDSDFFKCSSCNCFVHFACDLSVEEEASKQSLCSSCRF